MTPDSRTDRHRATALLAVAVAAVLFGTAGVARDLGPDGWSSSFVGSWRALVGGAGLVVAATIVGRAPWRFPARPGWTALGGAAVVGYQLAFFAAADRVGVGPAAVVTIGTGPLVAGLIDAALFGVAVSRRWVAGVTLAILGIVALSWGVTGDSTPTGWAFAVAAGCCYPAYGAAAQRLMADRPPLTAIATVFGAGAVLTVPLVAVATSTDLGASTDGATATAFGPTLAMIAYLGLGATALAYGLWAIGLDRLSLRDTVTVTLVEPAAAVALAAVLVHEPLTAGSVAAMVVVAAGVVLATTTSRQ